MVPKASHCTTGLIFLVFFVLGDISTKVLGDDNRVLFLSIIVSTRCPCLNYLLYASTLNLRSSFELRSVNRRAVTEQRIELMLMTYECASRSDFSPVSYSESLQVQSTT